MSKSEAEKRAAEIDLWDPKFLENEFEDYKWLRENLPVAEVKRALDKDQAWLFAGYEENSACLRNTADFSNEASEYAVRPMIPQAIDPPAHTSYRRIMNKWFTPDAMTKMEPHLEEFAADLIEKMVAKDEFDFIEDFADPFPAMIFCELMGFPRDDFAWLMDCKNIMMHTNDGHTVGRARSLAKAKEMGIEPDESGELSSEDVLKVRGKITMELYDYFAKLLDERRAESESRDDLISRLLESKYDGERPLTQEELLDTMLLYYMGGLDTVASMFGLIIKSLAENKEKREEFVALMEDPDKVATAIEELTRYNSMVLLPRRVTRDLEFGGQELAADTTVICPTQAANRDPKEFPNPDEMIYDRVPNRHMAYGHGPHRCLGIHLARRELRIALQVFHRVCPDYSLHPDKPVEMYAGMKGVSSLWLVKG